MSLTFSIFVEEIWGDKFKMDMENMTQEGNVKIQESEERKE